MFLFIAGRSLWQASTIAGDCSPEDTIDADHSGHAIPYRSFIGSIYLFAEKEIQKRAMPNQRVVKKLLLIKGAQFSQNKCTKRKKVEPLAVKMKPLQLSLEWHQFYLKPKLTKSISERKSSGRESLMVSLSLQPINYSVPMFYVLSAETTTVAEV